MGNSRFRMFHLMPNVWFYKLRDFGRYRETHRRLVQCRSISRDRDESAIGLTATGFYEFGGCGGVRRGMGGKGTSSTFLDSRVVGALCSCTTTVGFVWNSRGRNDSSSSSEISDDEEEKNGNFYSKQPMVVLQQQKLEAKESYSTEFKQKLDHSQFGPEFMECSKRSWKHQSKHVIEYSYSSVAGLPSPVHIEDVDCEYVTMAEPDQALTTQKLELAQGPFVMNTHLKNSTSCIRSSSVYINNMAALSAEEKRQEEVPIYNMESTEMEKKSRCAHSLENNTMFDKSGNAWGKSAEKNTVFDSFAEVKASYDPQKDFRESMVQMITEKDIHFSRDLECLLQCYLSLNSDEYHHIILKVFDQVRSELKLS